MSNRTSQSNCPAMKNRAADPAVGAPVRDCSCAVAWVRCRDGKVPTEAVVAGKVTILRISSSAKKYFVFYKSYHRVPCGLAVEC
jgi:hypothetical protein